MNKLPFVTIIIPYKNNLDYLFIALKSIINQSYKNFKILIVYDDEDNENVCVDGFRFQWGFVV